MRTAIILATAAAALSLASPAFAGGHIFQVGVAAYNVHLGDLNLATAAGRAEALGRIETAAGRACGRDGPKADIDDCRRAVVADAARAGPLAPRLREALAERQTGVDAEVTGR